MATIGERVYKLRKQRKLSQRNLALRTDLTHSTISRIERDEVVPESSTIKTLADFFNVSFEYLLNGKENTNTDTVNRLSDDFQFALYDKTKDISSDKVKNDILKIIEILKKEEIDND